jgi:hemin uptake protein HemP
MQATLTVASSRRSIPTDAPASSRPASPDGAAMALTVESSALLQGQKAVSIHHNGLVYRLHATRLGKLILTK